jgi:hypothetical protein
MPANITDYSSPSNYQVVWIHHRINSTLQGDLNSEVPASLSQDNGTLGAWTLIIDGAAHPLANEIIVGGAPSAKNSDGSKYDIGELISNKIYEKSTTTNVTTTETTPGYQFQAKIIGNGRSPTTAWVSGNGTNVTGSDLWATLTTGGVQNWGLVYNGVVISGQSGTSDYSGYDSNGNPQYIDGEGNLYTRWQQQYDKDGATAYSVRKKLPDVTTTETNPVTIIETSFYDFYEVQHTSAAEVDAFSANVVLVIPQHIMQRNVTTAAGNMNDGSYILDNMFIRISPHMSAARLEQQDLYVNYGVQTKLVPIEFSVGADNVELSLNQIRDVSAPTPADNEILQYNSSSGQWENCILNSNDIFEGDTNEFYTDTRVQNYLNSIPYATEAYVDSTTSTLINSAISSLVDGAPDALNTLNELSAALGDDENIAATLATQIANLGISDLSDTATTAPSLGDSLVWDGSAWSPGLANLGISDLSDTATTAPSLGDSLVWDGSAWSPGTVIGGATISGTAPTAPEIGEFWFDDTTTGYLYTWDNSSWVQLTGIAGGGGATTLTDLGITDGTSGQVLTTDGSAGFTFTTVASSTTVGSVGTYIFAGPSSSGSVALNSTWAGSTLKVSGFASTNGFNDNTAADIRGQALSGTWKAMGHVQSTSRRASTLFLRIS